MNEVPDWFEKDDGAFDALVEQALREPLPGPLRNVDAVLKPATVTPAMQIDIFQRIRLTGCDRLHADVLELSRKAKEAAIEVMAASAAETRSLSRNVLVAVERRFGGAAAHYFVESIYDWITTSEPVQATEQPKVPVLEKI